MPEIWTIGHSNHSVEHFLHLLSMHGITAVADVRSTPYSIAASQFNREAIKEVLHKERIYYVHLGEELGPRSPDPACYENGKVVYGLLAATAVFAQGIERLRKGMERYRVAMMSAEKDPIACHRMVLICRHLSMHADDGLAIRHILEDGAIEDNAASERRLMQDLKIAEFDLFNSREEQIAKAYALQSQRIAYAL
ncbi:MAG TPA: DUF488 domain-containing protein [Syntrophales bacterium]|nr:DUF488 domain-containing protein [Syntrophales bacterium]